MPSGYAIVDQYGISNQWISLGVRAYSRCFYTTAPWCGVWLSDATGEGGNAHGGQANLCNSVVNGQYYCKIGVDAIRFRVPWPTYIPLVLKDY
jgi:hypothetical protein